MLCAWLGLAALVSIVKLVLSSSLYSFAGDEVADVLDVNVTVATKGLQFGTDQHSFCGKPRDVHI